jgi:hypothetical protein
MLEKTTKWLSWLCVLLAIVFAVCGFGATLDWFDRDIASVFARYSAYTIFLVGAALIGCILFDRDED